MGAGGVCGRWGGMRVLRAVCWGWARAVLWGVVILKDEELYEYADVGGAGGG